MLILSRKSMQKIQIGDSVAITVLGVRGKQVRIGIDAPAGIQILRSELQDPMKELPTALVPPGNRIH